MMFNYPYFSFPSFRRYSNFYSNSFSQVNVPSENKKEESRLHKPNSPTSNSQSSTNRVNYTYSYPYYVRRPFFSPYMRPSYYSTYNNNLNHPSDNCQKNEKEKEQKKTVEEKKGNNQTNSRSEQEESPFFELFGLKLYSDDILLICLIFFLYNEGVKDEGLFLSLIMLLLTN